LNLEKSIVLGKNTFKNPLFFDKIELLKFQKYHKKDILDYVYSITKD